MLHMIIMISERDCVLEIAHQFFADLKFVRRKYYLFSFFVAIALLFYEYNIRGIHKIIIKTGDRFIVYDLKINALKTNLFQ